MSDFVRRPTPAERQAAAAARASDPNTRHIEGASNHLRQALASACKRELEMLKRLEQRHSAYTPAEWDTLLGTAEYDNFKSDFNAFRTFVLALNSAADVPAAL
jgi:hypothetical protein